MNKYEIKYAYTGMSPDGHEFGESFFYLFGKTEPTEKQAKAGALKLIRCKNPNITIISIKKTDELT